MTISDETHRPVPDRFLVAFSFAGEQRDLVRTIAEATEQLLGLGTVFYDEWYEGHLAGTTGDLKLREIYRQRSEVVVMCASAEYGAKTWTLAEWDSIRERHMKLRAEGNGAADRLLPLRVADGEVEGLLDNTIWLDARKRTHVYLAGLILQRVRTFAIDAGRPRAFLAQTQIDLEVESQPVNRPKLRRFLEQDCHFAVSPASDLLDLDPYQPALQAEMARCDAFVQLLSPNPWKGGRCDQAQFYAARDQKLPQFCFRGEMSMDTITDEKQKSFIADTNAIVEQFEDFKQHLQVKLAELAEAKRTAIRQFQEADRRRRNPPSDAFADNEPKYGLVVDCDRGVKRVAAREPDQETTVAVILGAQQWPECNKAALQECRDAYLELSKYLSETLNISSRNMKNLFDSPLSPPMQIQEVKAFLDQRLVEIPSQPKKVVTDLIVYFVGHGERLVADDDYYMYLRCTCNTTPQNTRVTGLSATQLKDCLENYISRLRCHLVLDACHSQEAVPKLHLDIDPEEETLDYARQGLSVFCSSSAGIKSKVGEHYPLHTESWLEVLKSGLPNKGKRLSFRDLREPCIEYLKIKYPQGFPLPHIASPCMTNGAEVADVPFFPNPAYLPETPKLEEIAKTIAQESFVKDEPYLLGQKFEGRQQERSDLTEWLEGRHSEFGQSKLFFICDFGGAGKTALVWNWAQSPATQDYLASNGIGYYWATFYAKNYSWRSFIKNLADKLSVKIDWQRAHQEQWKPHEIDNYLINCLIERLREEPWLIILDGIEREMDAFDARGNQLLDSEEQDLRKEMGDVSREEQLFHSPLFARFLRRLLETKTKVILTSRHVPEDLRGQDGKWLPGVYEYEFRPMGLEDARKVWDLGRGPIDPEQQATFFEAVNYHPQVIGVISSALKALGFPAFEDWFNDLKLTTEERRALVDPNIRLTTRRHLWIELGTRDILKRGVTARLVLGVIVHQSDATEINQLEERLVDPADPKPFRSREELLESIKFLQSRWLLGADLTRGMVDIHPVIRSQMQKYSRQQSKLSQAEADQEILQIASKVEGSIHSLSTQEEKDAIASILNHDVIRNLAELHGYTTTLNHYLGRFYPDPADGTNRFLTNLPRLRYRKDQGSLLFITASMLSELGSWTDAVELYHRAALAYRLIGDYASVEDCERSQNWQALYGGSLLESERFRLDLLEGERESPEQRDVSCFWLAACMAIRRAPQTRELQALLPVEKNRWTLQATAEACYYLGETADYQKAETSAEAALRRKENMGLSEVLWEELALGMVQLRIGKMNEAFGRLQEVIERGRRYSYPIIPLFATAGYIECLVQVSQTKTKHEKEVYLNEALYRYRRFEDGQHDQYQIPAAEAHLAAARVHLAQGNRKLAAPLALKALDVARGTSFPFCYSGGEQRALDFLASELKCEAKDIPPVVPCVNEIEFNQHEERISRLIAKLKEAAAQNDSASAEKESP